MLNTEALNEAQRRAVTDASGRSLLVTAGPGSGKTLVITRRILYLIQELHVPPEAILVVTFTKEAALSMQRRFLEQSDLPYPVSFGTFHSIFYHILTRSKKNTQFNILTEKQKKDIFLPILRRQVIEKSEGRQMPAGGEEAAQLLSAFSYYKNTGDGQEAQRRVSEEFRPVFWECYHQYERERHAKKLIDFDDMVCECHRLLAENASLRAEWQGRFRHILIDEFQDINHMQMAGVELLKGERCSLFAVGDDDQSIYGFRGSAPECMRIFQEKFDAERIALDINYRSTKEIVEASLKVIAENKSRFAKELKSGSGDQGSPVVLRAFRDREEEYSYLTDRLCCGMKSDTLAVLFRTNISMQIFAAELSARGIPFLMKEKRKNLYEHEVVKDLWAYLELAQNPENRKCLLRILNRPVRYISREAVMARGDNLWDSMRNYYIGQNELPYRKERLEAVDRLQRDIKAVGKLSMHLAVKYILKKIGYEACIIEKNDSPDSRDRNIKQENQEIIEWVCKEAKKYNDFAEWKIERERASDSFEKKELCKLQTESNIRLMTVHASKGLEFDRVWIPDCNETVFPYGKMLEEESCEEERRIFYVAMTRAKKSLELLCLLGTKEHPRLPSRFLNPLFKTHHFETD